MSENAFADIGASPENNEAHEHLLYLKKVVQAFDKSGHPRIKPMQRKLNQAIKELATKAKTKKPDEIAKLFTKRVEELRIQTFSLLQTVVNQVRGTLQTQKAYFAADDKSERWEELNASLALFSKGLNQFLKAKKNNNKELEEKALALIKEASELLSTSINPESQL